MSYTPDEPALQLLNDRTWLQGAILTGVAYGSVVTIFSMCLRVLLQRRSSSNRKQTTVFLAYILVVMVLATLYMASNSKFTELAFVDNSNYPGGPSQYEEDMFSIPVDEMGNVSYFLSNWLTDALIIWRCKVIYTGFSPSPWVAIALPCLIYLGSFAMGILWLIQLSSPSSSPFSNAGITNVNFTIPFLSLSIALSIITTTIIVVRLMLHRHRITKVLGPAHGSHYTSIAAMVIESAMLWSIFALLFLVPFALGHPLANVFLQPLGPVQILASFLIIFRVAQGKGWSSDTTAQLMTTTNTYTMSNMRFGPKNSAPDSSHTRVGPVDVIITSNVDTQKSRDDNLETHVQQAHEDFEPLGLAKGVEYV